MAHTSEQRWASISERVSNSSSSSKEVLQNGQELYAEIEELFSFHSNSSQAVADQLFETTATTDQVAMVDDARAAMVAINNAATTIDLNAIRRMTP